MEHLPAATPSAIARVTLAIRDLTRTEAFYRDVVGLSVVSRDEGSVVLGAGGTGFLALREAAGAAADDPHEAGLFHTAFLLPDRAALADWLARAMQDRIPVDGASDHLVSEALYLTDPEGNGVEIYADRPRETWTYSGGQMDIGSLPLDTRALLAHRSAAGWDGAPEGSCVGHVHLRVGDVARAVEFYAGELGLRVMKSFDASAFMSWGGYHHHIAVNTWRSAGAGPRDSGRAGLRQVAFAVGSSETVRHDPWGTELVFGRP